MKISFLLPTRGRSDKLKTVLDSLLRTCNDPKNYEVVLVFDQDDVDHIQQFESWSKNFQYKMEIIDRVGYDNLQVYYNKAASVAEGEWLWVWNDDSCMMSKDWDLTIQEYSNQFLILNPWNTRECDAVYLQTHTMFPIFPKRYVAILGHISPWNHIDTYTEYVVEGLGLIKNEFSIVHTHDKEVDDTSKDIVYHRTPFPHDQLVVDRTKIANYLNASIKGTS